MTLAALEDGRPPLLSILAFARAETETDAEGAATAELESFGWTGIQVVRTGEVTDPDALPADFAEAMANALKFGCGLIVYDEP